jgi:hypothetical protein
MAIINGVDIKAFIQEIEQQSEETRRTSMKRRHDLYKDGGKEFLIEQIQREFGRDALKEMRLAPINVLKKVINKRSTIYKQPPMRKAEETSDQDLVDFYVEDLELNQKMTKANRYFNLFSNTVLYPVPKQDRITLHVVPPYLYSVAPSMSDPTKANVWLFNEFIEEGRVTTHDDLQSATGTQGWERDKGFKTDRDRIDSQERTTTQKRRFIVWTDEQHMTVDETGMPLMFEETPTFINPIGVAPVVNITKDRDAEFWATQGEDLVDLCLALQIGWTDILTIAKHQGFSILTVISPEEPKKLTIGVNRAVWLKQDPDGPTPSIGYVQAASPLSEYKDLLMELLGLTLTTNDMSANTVGGSASAKNFNSGFQALIEMSDVLEAIEQDKPVMRDAEKSMWPIIGKWHNFMFDAGVLNEDAKALGKFSDDVGISIQYSDMKPIESEQERITTVQGLSNLSLITRADSLRKLQPDLSDEDIEVKLKELDEEAEQRAERAQAMFPAISPSVEDDDDEDEEEEEEDGEESQI